jgi:hypothetical protein
MVGVGKQRLQENFSLSHNFSFRCSTEEKGREKEQEMRDAEKEISEQ